MRIAQKSNYAQLYKYYDLIDLTPVYNCLSTWHIMHIYGSCKAVLPFDSSTQNAINMWITHCYKYKRHISYVSLSQN